ncbi:hypothetical protein B7C51_01220 [Paenibacillus larvae subsp. pulvifaciens]|uniref:Uncharacterized protein n=1 Tax=Paenibacillus larvae subsp. pulvifaciens TaxID=1477 RepID=A0A1V0UNQ8_9BACL|nr:hypothetical protein BXP28_06590 [Paenibacillus larvae subsp. larvae]ARF66726.1 hypothetical protein B7C51_01220 [Paenibacillus larvae subsp. pulvifaciens]
MESTLEGKVTVRNVTKELVFPVSIQMTNDSWILSGKQSVTLYDFGLHYLHEAKDIDISFSIWFRPQEINEWKGSPIPAEAPGK